MVGQRVLELINLLVQLGDDPNRGCSGGRERLGDHVWRGQLLAAQRFLDLFGSLVQVAFPTAATLRRH